MSVFDYVFIYNTSIGRNGIVRADHELEAIERVEDMYGKERAGCVEVKKLDDIDNDYGVIDSKLFGWE